MARRRRPRRNVELERQLAAAALSGKPFTTDYLCDGLESLHVLRKALVEVPGAIGDRAAAVVRCRLPYGCQAVFYVVSPIRRHVMKDVHGKVLEDRSSRSNRLGRVALRTGREQSFASDGIEMFAHQLTLRCRNQVDAIATVRDALERARRRALAILEQATRWK
jgi:hypothetical protein